MNAELVWPVETLLGEGPIWVPSEDALWFVDIKQGRLHRYTPATDARDTFDIGGQPSFAVLADQGGLIVGNGLELQHVVDGAVAGTLATIDMQSDNRTNDATVDPSGRLWFGTMHNPEDQPSGRVYRFDGSIREMGGAATVTNGPAVSPDGRWLYHVDTIAGTIWRYDLSGDPQSLDQGEVFVQIPEASGNPDGVVVDSEGCVWAALWGGHGVQRYSPEGELLLRVEVPCANVTKIAFGGPDLRTCYVTSARVGNTDEELATQPLAGGLFRFEAPAPGIAPHAVRLG